MSEYLYLFIYLFNIIIVIIYIFYIIYCYLFIYLLLYRFVQIETKEAELWGWSLCGCRRPAGREGTPSSQSTHSSTSPGPVARPLLPEVTRVHLLWVLLVRWCPARAAATEIVWVHFWPPCLSSLWWAKKGATKPKMRCVGNQENVTEKILPKMSSRTAFQNGKAQETREM